MLVLTKSRTTGEDIDYIKRVLLLQKQKAVLGRVKKPIDNVPDFRRPDSNRVTGIKIGQDGSIRTHVGSEKYPIRSWPDTDTVFLTAYYKRLVPLILKSLAGQNWFKRIITVLALKYNFHIVPEWFKYVFSTRQFLLNDENYCPAVKELRRVLKGVIDDNLIDAIGLVLEYDSAYRYVFQDIISEFDRREFNKNPIKEINRLFDLLVSRSISSDVTKFSNVFKFVKIYLKLNPKVLKTVKEVVGKMKIGEIYPSEEDYYWMLYLKVYNCFGMTEDERTKQFNQLKEQTNGANSN